MIPADLFWCDFGLLHRYGALAIRYIGGYYDAMEKFEIVKRVEFEMVRQGGARTMTVRIACSFAFGFYKSFENQGNE
ncbi:MULTISPECIES: hypothetical protein [Methylomonas]|uniref:Uncharacterized protein n=1 Tax=Methylomonas denitrificans TaxID=1538553 RepID=A0A140E4E6_9GAMM|nr:MULTISPECIES: hypothetical protein [Methylomonas]AMK75270.1 hypothetical protein JT25_002005 [Methylomonas denitrificans]OAH99338.1 hypothetical protein A1342_04210 [Methylomonas methanica]